MSEHIDPDLYERACDLAEENGCVFENECWDECVDAALHELTTSPPPHPSTNEGEQHG